MAVKLATRKKREPINDRMTLPLNTSLKNRYERIKSQLADKEYDSLHELTRECINDLLDDLEKQLSAS